jgi:hypothetical protein
MHRPSWYRDGQIVVSYAPTVGINKDGEELYVVDPETGSRTDRINDLLAGDVEAILQGSSTETLQWVSIDDVMESGIAVPTYYDRRTLDAYFAELQSSWPDYESIELGDLIDREELLVRGGHGSPSADLRDGVIPYIKVSDLRAGQVNINPTNRVSEVVAEQYWGGEDPGLRAFDLITPSRSSKNIGEIAVLMPGQERVVLTKEMLVMRPGPAAEFDAFYLLWAMSLQAVRNQWGRIVFMQTNREDVGRRFREIQIPMAASADERRKVGKPFGDYYRGVARLRKKFLRYLAEDGRHHVFLSSSDESSGGRSK